jgi:hypothetical protein
LMIHCIYNEGCDLTTNLLSENLGIFFVLSCVIINSVMRGVQ